MDNHLLHHAPERQMGADGLEHRLGADALERRLGADALERRLGADAQERRLGADAQERRLGADAQERRLGADEGEAFDRRLRERERIEREERLSRIAWGAEPSGFEDDLAGGGGLEGEGGDLDDADGDLGSPLAPPGGHAASAYGVLLDGRPSLSQLQMERELRRLTAYYNAVEGSRVWRFVQRLRRIAGRAW